jgi:hypothetical protein
MRIQTRIDPTGPVTVLVAGRVDAACIADFDLASDDVTLINCPEYVIRWMRREL